MIDKHVSVFKQDVIESLKINPEGIYIDGTFGRGGHSLAICERLTSGHLIATDLDSDAITYGKKLISDKQLENKLSLYQMNFGYLNKLLNELQISSVDGILLDLGVSSPQFDNPDRGFSYRYDAKLDMRMNQEQLLNAHDIVNQYSLSDLQRILFEYGEEKFAKKIALKIVENRPINTTFELVDVIKSALPSKVLSNKGHPAKKSFQAIRIAVNSELESLENALGFMPQFLKKGGIMAVISFHSLEDKLVKKAFNQLSKPHKVDKRIPLLITENPQFMTKKIMISNEEVLINNRSHSAILRILERID